MFTCVRTKQSLLTVKILYVLIKFFELLASNIFIESKIFVITLRIMFISSQKKTYVFTNLKINSIQRRVDQVFHKIVDSSYCFIDKSRYVLFSSVTQQLRQILLIS